MNAGRKCRLAMAMVALSTYSACGDATTEEAGPVCSVDGCTRPRRSKGMCKHHYERARVGVPLDYRKPSLVERLLTNVAVDPGGCWIWTGGQDGRGPFGGYGRMKVDGRKKCAHRVSYETFVGPIPPGLDLDHLCRVRICVNPNHLEPVTHQENTQRGVAARKARRLALVAAALSAYACGTTAPSPPTVPEPVEVVNPEAADPTVGLEVAIAAAVPRAEAPKVARNRRPRPATPARTSPPAGGGDTWAALARCESTMTNDGGAPFYGYFQFSASTWHSLGYSGTADQYPYSVQLEAAQRLQARSGWGQWPACSRKLGLL